MPVWLNLSHMIIMTTMIINIIVIYVKNMNFGIFTRRGWRRSSRWCYSGAFWQRHIRPGQRKRAAYIFSPTMHCLWKWSDVRDEKMLKCNFNIEHRNPSNFHLAGFLGVAWRNSCHKIMGCFESRLNLGVYLCTIQRQNSEFTLTKLSQWKWRWLMLAGA